MTDAVLVVNAGSSSLKFALFDVASSDRIAGGAIDAIGGSAQLVIEEDAAPSGHGEPVAAPDHASALAALDRWLTARWNGLRLRGVGHRVVHGGRAYAGPVLVDADVLARLETLVPLAPLHQPHNLAAIRAFAARQPGLPQVACFDTAFHQSQPEIAKRYALPGALTKEGIVRYGFHGLSYEYVASVIPKYLGRVPRRTVVAHLGQGASMAGLDHGRSVATTMGFTALDGLPMGRRCGALDPGVILYLMQARGLDVEQVSDLLYRRSGLLGVSGISDDMRALLASDDPGACEAIDLFVYRIARELGSLAGALGGLDALVFTGGIGENAAPIRLSVGDKAAWLGVAIDAAANQAGGPKISSADSRVEVLVIPTDEALTIAQHTLRVLGLNGVTRATP